MDERYPNAGYSLKAPGAEPSGVSYRLPSRDDDLHVDDHLADIDFRDEEKVGGKVYKTMGAEFPHAAQNGEIDYVLRGLLKPEYCVATVPVAALLDAGKANAAVVQGLEAQGDPEIQRIRDEGKSEGRAEGKAEGHAEGKAEGHLEGRVEGLRSTLLKVFAMRGLEVSDEVRNAVASCDDPAVLNRWFEKAMKASTAGEALG